MDRYWTFFSWALRRDQFDDLQNHADLRVTPTGSEPTASGSGSYALVVEGILEAPNGEVVRSQSLTWAPNDVSLERAFADVLASMTTENGSVVPSPESALVDLRGIPDQGEVGRNEACPCGSGRKFKRCHEGTPVVEYTQAWLVSDDAMWRDLVKRDPALAEDVDTVQRSQTYRLVGGTSTPSGATSLGIGIAADVPADVPPRRAASMLRAELDRRVNSAYPWLRRARVHEMFASNAGPAEASWTVFGEARGVERAALRRSLAAIPIPTDCSRLELDVSAEEGSLLAFRVELEAFHDDQTRLDAFIAQVEGLEGVTYVDAEIGY